MDQVIPNEGKVQVRSQKMSSTDLASSGPEVPPKAKGRTSGQKNRGPSLVKQQLKQTGDLGQANQNGSTALPGFDPVWTNDRRSSSSEPLSPRITEVVDSSLLPPPLRSKYKSAAKSALCYADCTDKQKYQPALEVQPAVEYQQSIVHQYQQTTSAAQPNSIYGTLPPLPIRMQSNDSQPAYQSPRLTYHRRQDTPYSPDDVGKSSTVNSPGMPTRDLSALDKVIHTSPYASSDVLPTPVALEEWASEQRRIAHGQPAAIQVKKSLDVDKAKEKEKTLKKTKSLDTKFFRSRKGKSEQKEKTAPREALKDPDSNPNASQATSRPQTSRLISQQMHHPGIRWDAGSFPPSPELVRPAIASAKSDMNDNPRSDSVSDKMVVDPQLRRAHSDQSSIVTTTTTEKFKKPSKILRWMEAYSKNVEGLQMVQ